METLLELLNYFIRNVLYHQESNRSGFRNGDMNPGEPIKNFHIEYKSIFFGFS